MSLLNAFVIDGMRALVAVDTMAAVVDQDGSRHAAAGLQQGQRFDVSKALVLPHHGAVIAARGSPLLVNLTFMRSCLRPARDFDALVGAMAGHLGDSLGEALRAGKSAGVSLVPQDQEVLLVGWSARAQAMEINVFTRNGATFSRSTTPDYAAPWPWKHAPRVVASTDDMHALCMEQIEGVRALEAGAVIGGRLTIIDMHPAGMAISTPFARH